MYSIERTHLFIEWYQKQDSYTQMQIASRFFRIEQAGHFGLFKYLGDELYELKWKSGLRVYYAYCTKTSVLILLGGTKNGQDKDIKKAKKQLE